MAPVVVLHVLIGGVATFMVTAVLLLLAIVLMRFERSWASWLLLIGAVAAFVAISGHMGWVFAAEHGWLQRTGLMTFTPVVATLLTFIELMSFCIPVALLVYCLKAVRFGLTKRWS
jgi:hypothetical protein